MILIHLLNFYQTFKILLKIYIVFLLLFNFLLLTINILFIYPVDIIFIDYF